MASFKLVVLIVALLIGSVVVQAQKFEVSRCGRDEHFEHCGKEISCQRSCERPEGGVCLALCTPRCVCNEDRVRNHLNECVHLRECPRGRRIF